MNRFSFFPAVAVLGAVGFLTLAGCGGGGKKSPSPTPTPTPAPVGTIIPQTGWSLTGQNKSVQTPRKWTFLVYMNGANDLEQFGSLNINQMEQVGSSDEVNIVVQYKRIKGYDTSNGNWTNTRRYFITKDGDFSTVNSQLLSQRDNVDMGSVQTLQDFIKWGTTTFPAQRYCLVVWNHGAGWRAQKITTAKNRGISYDDAANNGKGTHIDTIQMPDAIDFGGGRKWDVLALDASLMQMAEVAYEIRDKATYLVGSEESPPGEGYPYNLFLSDLVANPNMDTRDFAFDIADKTLESYGADYGTQESDGSLTHGITQSVLDPTKMAEVASAVNNLGASLLAVRNRYSTQMNAARLGAESYSNPDYYENKDLLDYVRLLSQPASGSTTVPVPDASVQSAVAQVQSAVNAAVLHNVRSAGHPRSSGLALFIPSQFAYSTIDREQADGFGQRYSAISFAKAAPNWQSFLTVSP